MTSYRRPETRAKGWTAEIRWWKDAQVKAVVHPGRYVSDERAFAQLYAEHFGRPPYKLVVVNVRYGLGPGTPPGDTDFVVTRDTAGAPWLVHDFGGALRPESTPTAPLASTAHAELGRLYTVTLERSLPCASPVLAAIWPFC